jgi:periplasmic mercuric ion binding protein
MRHLSNFTLVVAIAIFLCAGKAEAATQRVNMVLGGEYCQFYLVDVEKALKNVAGVKSVDFDTMKAHVVITMVAGKVNPRHLLSAIRSVKGDGYHCTGSFDGEPGPVQNFPE